MAAKKSMERKEMPLTQNLINNLSDEDDLWKASTDDKLGLARKAGPRLVCIATFFRKLLQYHVSKKKILHMFLYVFLYSFL